MVQAQWKINAPGCSDCCDDTNCRPYVPCCIEAINFTYAALVSTVDENGPLSSAIVGRFTLHNRINDEESVDWSTFNEIDCAGASGQDSIDIPSGIIHSNCTYGINIPLENWFCEHGLTNDQFVAKITIWNPHDETIYFQPRHGGTSLCLTFETFADSACCLVLETPEPSFSAIAAGASKLYTLDFSVADWSSGSCYGTCYTPEDIEVIISTLPNVSGDSCFRPMFCIQQPPQPAWTGDHTTDCESNDCPECPCTERTSPAGCVCECEAGNEPLNSCKSPKQLLAGFDENYGEIEICESINNGFGASRRLMECWNSDCKLTAQLLAPRDTFTTWSYNIKGAGAGGSGGASVSLNPAAEGLPTRHCIFYTVKWGVEAGGDIFIEVDGVRKTATGPTNPLTGGTCYVLAFSSFTLRE